MEIHSTTETAPEGLERASPATCVCPSPLPLWRLAHNEDGWWCERCSSNLGYRPDLDQAYIYEKVEAVLLWLHEREFVYVSNASMGESIRNVTIRALQAANRYDQISVIRALLDTGWRETPSYWSLRADAWLRARNRVLSPADEMRAAGAPTLPGFDL